MLLFVSEIWISHDKKVEEEPPRKRKGMSSGGQNRWMRVRITQAQTSTWIKMPFWKLSLYTANMPYKIAYIKKNVKRDIC